MNRTPRIAALALLTASALLCPATLGTAGAAEGAHFLQDPAGDEKQMRSVWTEDDAHKVEGRLRFHPAITYKTVPAKGPAGAPEFETRKADPKTLAWMPEFEFGWAVSDSAVLKKAVTTKTDGHPIVLWAALRGPDGKTAATVTDRAENRAATGKLRLPGGKKVACDSGEYTVEWKVTRTGYTSVGGSLRWNASCENHRIAFSPDTGKVKVG
ncbi:hypothetical protein ACN20G_08020 [Streptomyces sp. BI20]|uniref:hypothetical protein n=1 Tax=Streptomyces sp. BI20 TaxID=3403460 RepID=UPI003C71A0A9